MIFFMFVCVSKVKFHDQRYIKIYIFFKNYMRTFLTKKRNADKHSPEKKQEYLKGKMLLD